MNGGAEQAAISSHSWEGCREAALGNCSFLSSLQRPPLPGPPLPPHSSLEEEGSPPLSFPQGLQFPGSLTARKQNTGATKCQNVKEKQARPKLPPPPHKHTLTKLCVTQASVPTSLSLSLHLEDKATPRTQDSIGC